MISTYIEHPRQWAIIQAAPLHHVIIDLPFCSIRSHSPYDWTYNELQALVQNGAQLWLNLDGLYTDSELTIIQSNIQTQHLAPLFKGFRIQDLGLAKWLHCQFPDHGIHLNHETGMQNQRGISMALKHHVSSLTFNHETPYRVMQEIMHPTVKTPPFELFVQGPILIQYARRRFLKNHYTDIQTPLWRTNANDPELPGRTFTFLDTEHGHFMMAHFHRCLAQYRDKLCAMPTLTWLIDARGESDNYWRTAIALYTHLNDLSIDDINTYVQALKTASNRPQKPSFFLSNNTDYDWRNDAFTNQKKQPIGQIVSSSKTEGTILLFFTPITKHPLEIMCINPDDTEGAIDMAQITDVHDQPIKTIIPFEHYLIKHPLKGVQTKGQLYLKDT
ncbi:MAG: U32 family peptidase [Candidatus Marinamargulisbacteria bacterium]